jgi:hypothetical protein|tara:strand:+ start:438 stop:920 length:483 start_codon:yes stop_codon:yes gene_type:complete
MTKTIYDTHFRPWIDASEPVHTKLQEVLFILYDNKNVEIPLGGSYKSLVGGGPDFITLGDLAYQLRYVGRHVFGCESSNEPEKEFEYTYSETSVDTRVWTVTSPEQLTEEEVVEYAQESECDKEGEVTTMLESPLESVRVKCEGTRYGSDTEIKVKGELK